jgi:hypothetical protein
VKSLEFLVTAGEGPPSRHKVTRFPAAVFIGSDSGMEISSKTNLKSPVNVISAAGRFFLLVSDSSILVRIGGKQATPKTLYELKDGSILQIRGVKAEVCISALPGESGTRTGFAGLLDGIGPDLDAPASPSLICMSGENAGDVFSMVSGNEGGGVLFGRSSVCQIRSADPYVSGRHFVISHIKGKYRLSDSGSSNGTAINGKKAGRMSILRDGDLLSAGKISFIFLDPEIEGFTDAAPFGFSIWRERTSAFRLFLPAMGAGLIGFSLTLGVFLLCG